MRSNRPTSEWKMVVSGAWGWGLRHYVEGLLKWNYGLLSSKEKHPAAWELLWQDAKARKYCVNVIYRSIDNLSYTKGQLQEGRAVKKEILPVNTILTQKNPARWILWCIFFKLKNISLFMSFFFPNHLRFLSEAWRHWWRALISSCLEFCAIKWAAWNGINRENFRTTFLSTRVQQLGRSSQIATHPYPL